MGKPPSVPPAMEPIQDSITGAAESSVSRRGFLQGVAAAGALSGLPAAASASSGAGSGRSRSSRRRRASEVLRLRWYAAWEQFRQAVGLGTQRKNDDERRYDDRRASFSKTLPHDNWGEVETSAYTQMVSALQQRPGAIMPRSSIAARELATPNGAWTYDLVGADGHSTRIAPPPAFASAEVAAELGEVYWLALTRDVPFLEYPDHADIAAAAADLNSFSHQLAGGPRGPDTLFRGEAPGDAIGPFVSQLLWLDVPFGPSTIEQRYTVPVAGQDFMTEYDEWLAIQRGVNPRAVLRFDSEARYIYNHRALGEYVHRDVIFQAYLNAALIMIDLGPGAMDPGIPFLPYVSGAGETSAFAVAEVLALVDSAARLGLRGAWFQKWLMHRRLRPEVYGGRIEQHVSGARDYEIDSDILASDALARAHVRNGNYLLPQAFPEGSPTHPSFPAGHAAMAGACCTVLKALFDEDFEVPRPVEASADGRELEPWRGEALTLGNEIDKLASNITLGRDAAGVHYRSDGIQGIALGEQQGIALLSDYSRVYGNDFGGFELRRFDGRRIRIDRGSVRAL